MGIYKWHYKDGFEQTSDYTDEEIQIGYQRMLNDKMSLEVIGNFV